jgi:hypothetical protein
VTSDGLRTLAPNIHHMTRGYRTRLVTGRTLAALGGANSIDRHLRSKTTWWREESITDNDLDRLGTGPVDILIGHDAPRFVPTLDSHPERTEHEWPMNAVMYANEGRQTFHTGFMQVRPKLYLGGHYHLPVDETVGYWTGDIGFATRLVLLDQISAPASASAAILDVEQFTLQFYTSDGVEVPVMPQNTELTTRSMGAWMVWTLTAKYLFDMDHGTVECVSGGAEAPFWAGEHQRLRKLEACRVGEPARWTMHPKYRDGDDTWHVSSIVRFIEPAPEA